MSEHFDPDAAAGILADAWRGGTLLTELPAPVRPATMAQGYDIQDRLIERLGEPTLGWKLGMGSYGQKRQSGVGRSIAGRLLASHVHRPGDTITLPNAAPVTVEFEIAYVLGRAILPNEGELALAEAIAETRVTFELVLSRFIDRRAVGWPSFAADNAGFHALVVGEPVDPACIPALVESLAVTLDGEAAARAVTGDDVTDPVAALTDLVSTARERGMVLPAGSIVSTGTVSRPFHVAATAAEVTARFLGQEFGFRMRRSGSPPPA
jgi:2-keto-4-pentenoate hydratase